VSADTFACGVPVFLSASDPMSALDPLLVLVSGIGKLVLDYLSELVVWV
jgi:hypothetical protein